MNYCEAQRLPPAVTEWWYLRICWGLGVGGGGVIGCVFGRGGGGERDI